MKDTGNGSRYLLSGRPVRAIITVITLWSFLFNISGGEVSSAWAARTPLELTRVGSNSRAGSEPGRLVKDLRVETFSLPENFGRIKDAWKSDSGENTIVHIQDAHCNYAAQLKIAEMLEYLSGNYQIDIVNLEGGAKDYDLTLFTSIADKTVREKVSDQFVKEGLINGAEYFAINNPDKVTLWGVEEADLYIENLNVYRESLKYKAEVDKELQTLTHILNNLKRHIYPKELFELDMKYTAYKADALDFKEYIRYLMAKAKRGAIDVARYKDAYLLNQVLEEEANVDFTKANRERDVVIDRLQKKLSRADMEELVLKTLEVKTEKMSQRHFYIYIMNKAKASNLDISDFPELHKYIIYLSMYDAVDKAKVIEEVGLLEDKLKEMLCENPTQRELVKLSKNLAILKNIFGITLTKEDYRYYEDHRSDFDIRRYIDFIDKNAPPYNITARLDAESQRIDGYRENITKFYECSLRRDEAFIKNMKFSSTRMRPVAIVTGGFHTENLCSLFKTNQISYVSILPNFKNEDGYESPYFRLLAGEVTGIQKRIYSVVSSATTSTSMIQIASILSPELSGKVWGDTTIFDVWVWMETKRVMGTNIIVVGAQGEELMRFAEMGKEERISPQQLLAQVTAAKTAAREGALRASAPRPEILRTEPAEVTRASVSGKTESEVLYAAAANIVPQIARLIKRDAPTFDLAPAKFEDISPTTSSARDVERVLGKGGHVITARHYAIGTTTEDTYNSLEKRIETSNMIDDFNRAVSRNKAARWIIRVVSREHKNKIERYLEGKLSPLALARTNVIIEDIGRMEDTQHLNPVMDLFVDIGIMEINRYTMGDYEGRGTAEFEEFKKRVANLLSMSVMDLAVDGDNLEDVLKRIFEGNIILQIKKIDWRAIQEWKKDQDAVLRSL